ncbi:MAG: hypothetical protein ACLQU4_15575 [Limisphaerales bacterium]
MKRLFHVMLVMARILGAFALLVIALFCVFGFLASFEPGNEWPWKAGYGALGCCCLTGAVALLHPRGETKKAHATDIAP